MTNLKPTLAHIRNDSPRAEDWRRVFGGTTVPLRSLVPVVMDGPDGPKNFYQVDVGSLTPEQRARVVEHVAKKFGLSPKAVEEDLASEYGLPILVDDVSVTFDARLVVD